MTVEDFIAMTQRVVAKEGFDEYLPTLVLPARNNVRVLEGIPPEVDVEAAALNWAARTAGFDEDYFLAFKLDDMHFKVVARLSGVVTEQSAKVEKTN